MTTVTVTRPAELLDALAAAHDIEVDGSLSGMPMITLPPGVTLRSGTLRFGAKGIRLTSDNVLEVGEVTGLGEVSVTAAHGQRIVGWMKEER